MPKVTFNNSNSLFFQSVKQSVEDYFNTNNIRKTGNWKLYVKTIVLIPLAVALYLILLFVSYPAIVGILLSGLLGFVLAAIGFNVMHDACHGSYSRRKWVNDIMGLTSNAIGGNAYIWKVKHNIIHHTYTNVDGVDDDIANYPLLRQCPTQKRFAIHRYQHLYLFLLYALSSFAMVLAFDFVKYFSKKIHTTPLRPMKKSDHIVFWISKILYLVFYVAIPVMLVGWMPWLFGFISLHIVMGLTLSIVFQLAHVVEQTSFETSGLSPVVIESEWAVHQVKTTANFSAKSKIISWLVGGLNFQIEHHLFPRISHVHYAALSRVIRENCDKFNLSYNYYPTLLKALRSHVSVMRQLGKK